MVADKAQPGTQPSGSAGTTKPEGTRPPRTLRPRRDWLAQGLREIYEETLNDPIPDSFRILLDELERKEKTARPATEGRAEAAAEPSPGPASGPGSEGKAEGGAG